MKLVDFSPSSQALLLLLLLQKFPWTDLSRAGPSPGVLPGTEDGLQGLGLPGGPSEELQRGLGSRVAHRVAQRVAHRVRRSRPVLGSCPPAMQGHGDTHGLCTPMSLTSLCLINGLSGQLEKWLDLAVQEQRLAIM